ncbi:MAG: hypothetical protein K2J20_03805, partial [Bacilli bacterium]|nr:hypothetical protein [Bacilli bacterium]
GTSTHTFNNLTSGTEYTIKVYVKDVAGNQSDEEELTAKTAMKASDIIAELDPKPTTENMFANVATTDEGTFYMEDPVYGGTSKFWRGAATTNHVIFADKCWRIIRINGDGTIRLIYNGTPSSAEGSGASRTCTGNGANSAAVIMGSSNAEKYYATSDGKYDKSSYVGWTYTTGSQRPANTSSGTDSNAKTQTEKWYKEQITDNGFDSKVATGYFCNDRNTKDNEAWRETGSTQYYAGYVRLSTNKTPSLDCPSGDRYNLKVGAITADEVSIAGGVYGQNNTSYYLYTGANYWTMSPSYWYSTSSRAFVFFVRGSDGCLTHTNVGYNAVGLRPVINLNADVVFEGDGDGTLKHPY